jgi:hypothetical protein
LSLLLFFNDGTDEEVRRRTSLVVRAKFQFVDEVPMPILTLFFERRRTERALLSDSCVVSKEV